MRFLLDTHIWLWLINKSDRLKTRTRRELQDPKNELWLSPISTWEALTLHHKGRIRLIEEPGEWIKRATSGTKEAPLTHEIAVAARELPIHQDPADRFLVATAAIADLTFVTADEKLLALPHVKTLGNR